MPGVARSLPKDVIDFIDLFFTLAKSLPRVNPKKSNKINTLYYIFVTPGIFTPPYFLICTDFSLLVDVFSIGGG